MTTKNHGTGVDPRIRPALEQVAVAGLYCLAVWLGLKFAAATGAVGEQVSLIWPATGLGVAAVALCGLRLWPAIAVGSLLGGVLAGAPWAFLPFSVAAAVLEGVVGGGLLRWLGFQPALARVRDVALLTLAGLVPGTALSATVGSVGLWALGTLPEGAVLGVWWPWWLANLAGGLIVAPVLLSWAVQPRPRWRPRRLVEAAGLAVLLAAATYLSFSDMLGLRGLPLAYLPFPLLVWAAARFRPCGAATATLLVAVLAAIGTVGGAGPFALEGLTQSMLLLWVFLIVAALTAQLVSAVVAERERARQALRESEAQFRAIVEDQTEMIVRIRPDTTRSFVNEAYCRTFGQPAEALVGTSFLPQVAPEDRQAVHEKIAALTPQNPVAVDIHRVVLPDGSVGWQEWTDRGLFDERGQLSEIQSVGRDISARRQAELARERLAQAIEQAGEAVIITDPNGTITYVNPAFERITGYSPAEALGQNPRILKSDRNEPALYTTLWKTLKAGRVWKGHLVNRRKDGSLYEEDSTISPVFDAEGQVAAYVEIQRDVTQQLRLEAQLREAAKLEAIGRLAGGVAHDFNNQLTIIRGFCELLLQDLGPQSPHRETVEEIWRAADQSARLTSQLLAFGRKQTLNPRLVDLGAALGALGKTLGRMLGEQVELHIEAPDGLDPVHVDPVHLQQAVINLALNARDAMAEGGTLTLSADNVELSGEQALRAGELRPGRYVRLTVQDTGHGMDRQTVERVFEPFFTTKELGKGTGLGLAMVHGFVMQSGGQVTVESEPGRGTTFRIYLPAAQGEAAQVERPAAPEPGYHGAETILLVEDEPSLRQLVARVLRERGYAVLEADRGGEALRQAEEHDGPIDLLVTDVVMPGLGGPELADQLRQRRPGLRVLFITGYSERAVRPRPEDGVALLTKPFSPTVLLQQVRALLSE